MLNFAKITTDYFVQELKNGYRRTYSDLHSQFINIIAWTGHLVMENISNSNALYHNADHTAMVTLAGQAILEGKHLCEGGVEPRDWLHFMVAVLCHDIGYVRGVCRDDRDGRYATGVGQETVEVPPGGTDIALTPYHVDRSKLFVRERFGGVLIEGMDRVIDAELIASYIEMTRFPPPEGEQYKDTKGYAGLVRAADFVGQLGDPNYLRKTPALYYEFEELGANEKMGYKRPGDLRASYAKFYWNVVNPLLQDALVYLRVTHVGKQWIASLHSHVFEAEHSQDI